MPVVRRALGGLLGATVTAVGMITASIEPPMPGPATRAAPQPDDRAAERLAGTPRAGTPDGMAGPRLTAVEPVLRLGSRGSAVARVQRLLAELRFQVRRADGVFDTETRHAVVAFQKLHGLPRTGEVDAVTEHRLTRTAPAVARHALPGVHFEVDLATQLLTVVRDGLVERVYDASTGTAATPTPTGSFTVQYQIDGWRYAPLGPMYRPSYINDTGIAVHGGEPVEPWPASNGCVRISDPSVDELFALLRPGTPVLVQ